MHDTVQISIRITPTMHADLKIKADQDNRSVHNYIINTLKNDVYATPKGSDTTQIKDIVTSAINIADKDAETIKKVVRKIL